MYRDEAGNWQDAWWTGLFVMNCEHLPGEVEFVARMVKGYSELFRRQCNRTSESAAVTHLEQELKARDAVQLQGKIV